MHVRKYSRLVLSCRTAILVLMLFCFPPNKNPEYHLLIALFALCQYISCNVLLLFESEFWEFPFLNGKPPVSPTLFKNVFSKQEKFIYIEQGIPSQFNKDLSPAIPREQDIINDKR